MGGHYASILDRIKSTAIDTLILIACFYMSSDIFETIGDVPEYVRITLFALFILYEPVFIALGATFGNYRNGIRVRKNSDYSKKINILQSLVRFFLKVSLGWISLLFILMNKKGRALHDIVSGSVMLKEETS